MTETVANFSKETMVNGLPLLLGGFHPINLLLYISVPNTNYVTEKKIILKIITDIFFRSHIKIAFPPWRTSMSATVTCSLSLTFVYTRRNYKHELHMCYLFSKTFIHYGLVDYEHHGLYWQKTAPDGKSCGSRVKCAIFFLIFYNTRLYTFIYTFSFILWLLFEPLVKFIIRASHAPLTHQVVRRAVS